jgi:hypothetical protein
MKRFAIATSALFVVVLSTTASAATPLTWVGGPGLGSDALPCAGAEHWVLSDATHVKSASLVVGGTSYAMQRDNGKAWSADTDAPIVLGDVAVATYDGDGTPTLSLGSCTPASSPSPTSSPTPSPSPSDPPGGVPVPGTGSGAQGGGGSSVIGSMTTLRTAGDRRAADPRSAPSGRSSTSGAGPRDPASHPIHAAVAAQGSGQTRSATGVLEPTIGDSVTSGIPDPRKPPLLLVIVVLVIIAAVCAVAAKHQFSHGAD